jgi:hypothetical protein
MQSPSSRPSSKYWLDGFPELVAEWDFDKNAGVEPREISAGSGRRVWWTCPKGPDHRWRAKPNNRTRGAGCPFCANRRPSVTNNLHRRFPAISAEWDPERNGKTGPSVVVATSTRVAWWRCSRDPQHTWRASVRDRTRDLSSCPFCANTRVCSTNSLLAMCPALTAEWHPTNNGLLGPDDVTPGSSRRVWWRCTACGVDWRASISNRVSRASGCPACARQARAGQPARSPSSARALCPPKPVDRPLQT